MDMYTLLYLKWITNKELLYSAWDSAQCYAAACMGGEFGGEWIHVYVWLSLFTVHLKLSHCMFSSVLFSLSVVSDPLRPLGLQHTRLPYASPSPGACPNSCPLGW